MFTRLLARRIACALLPLASAACHADLVAPAPVGSVSLLAAPAPWFAGDTVPLSVTVLATTGRAVTGRPVTFSASPADVATISPAGTLRFLVPGTALVTATVDGVSDTLSMSANGWTAAVLSPRPRAIVLPAGQSLALGAITRDTRGMPVADRPIAWSSSDTRVVSVTADGVATMIAPGAATVRMRSGLAQSAIPVTVTPAAPSAFAFDVRFTATPDEKLSQLVHLAAARWERVVTGALPAWRVDLDAGRCGRGSLAVHETLANIAVFVHVDTVDGPTNVLAWSSPCMMRKDGTTVTQPVLGVLTLDRSDLPALLADPDSTRLLNLLTHELGHVLGIGMDWHYFGLRVGENTADVRYLGAGARRAAYDLGFTADTADAVLVENLGGGSTRNMHWREATFADELMTGWVSPGRAPLSLVTVQSLADLGYEVQAAAADAFSVVDTPAWLVISGLADPAVRGATPPATWEGTAPVSPLTVTRAGRVEPAVR